MHKRLAHWEKRSYLACFAIPMVFSYIALRGGEGINEPLLPYWIRVGMRTSNPLSSWQHDPHLPRSLANAVKISRGGPDALQ